MDDQTCTENILEDFSASRNPHPCRAPVHEAGGTADYWLLLASLLLHSRSGGFLEKGNGTLGIGAWGTQKEDW